MSILWLAGFNEDPAYLARDNIKNLSLEFTAIYSNIRKLLNAGRSKATKCLAGNFKESLINLIKLDGTTVGCRGIITQA